MINQKNTALFESECKKMKLICDADTPLGVLHDYLMALKGEIVERMQNAQRQEQEIAKQQMKESEECNDS
jgi:hypothetical protein